MERKDVVFSLRKLREGNINNVNEMVVLQIELLIRQVTECRLSCLRASVGPQI